MGKGWIITLKIVKQYFKYFFLWFGGSTLMDYLFFEEVMNNEVIASNLWVSPIMALLFMIMFGVQKNEEIDATTRQLAGEKE